MRKVIAIIFLGFVVATGSVYAACYNNCEAVPDCAEMGYKLKGEIFCPDGSITCPFDPQYIWCKEYKCSDGRYSDTATLTGEKGYVCDEVDYHHRKCYHCHCDPDPKECKWSNLNKGNGELGERCCDGHYANCKNLCQDKVSVPAHAHAIKESCTGCEITKDIISSWACDDWYDKMADGCYARQCPDGYSITNPSLEKCGKRGLGDKGWTWESNGQSGENVCGKCTAKPCQEGYNTSTDVSNCGYEGTVGAAKAPTGTYSGDDECYKCVCNATDDNCPWTEGKQGTGELGEKCCNGKYSSCKNLCKNKVEVPEHAQGVKQSCTGCGITTDIVTSWTCNEGYTESGGACVPAKCPTDYSTDKQSGKDCGPESGWSVEFSGKSGEKQCGKCQCTSNCTWNNENKGDKGELIDKCCNGNYAKCNSKCGEEKTPPQNATCTNHCSACGLSEICTAWECAEGYFKNDAGTACFKKCEIGDVFYADGTCGKVDVYAEDSSPKPVGVIYWVENDGKHAKALNLKDLGRSSSTSMFDPENPYNTSYKSFKWNNSTTDISDLENWDCSNNDYKKVAATEDRSQNFWSAGASYTDIIAKAQTNNLQYAASVAQAFYPYSELQNNPLVGAGQWYLPTLGEWMDIYGYNYSNLGTSCESSSGANGHTKTAVNDTLTALKGKNVVAEPIASNGYWSSSEHSSSYAWELNTSTGSRYYYSKTNTYYVRVSMEIGCPSGAVSTLPEHAFSSSDSTCTTLSGETKYKSFECEDGYYKNEDGTACIDCASFKSSPCVIGSVFFADGTCSSADIYKACFDPSSSQPVGVVYWVESGGEYFKVLNLKDLGRSSSTSMFDPENPYNTSYKSFKWSISSEDIDNLKNWDCDSILSTAKTEDHNQDFWSAGESYTEIIKAVQDNDLQCAALAAKAFYPYSALKDNSLVGAGKWYLPTLGEMMDMYGYDFQALSSCNNSVGSHGHVKNTLNATLTILKEKNVEAETLANSSYWSSSEYNYSTSWGVNMSSGSRGSYGKTGSNYVRVSLDVGCPSNAVSEIPEHATGSKCTTLSGETKYKFNCNYGYSARGSSCVVAQCPTNFSTDVQQVSDCGDGTGWSVDFNGKSGEVPCGQCKCSSSCKWNDTNKGVADLSDLCCNGNYANCTNNCQGEVLPANAKGEGECVGCSQRLYTSWECLSGYRKTDDGTACCRIFATTTCGGGKIFFADGTCVTTDMFTEACDIPSDKVPVGVVYWVDNNEHFKVISLKNLGRGSNGNFNPADPYNTSSQGFTWGVYGTDISKLENLECSASRVDINGNRKHPFWSLGAKNAYIIAEAQDNDMQYPAAAASAFYPPEVNKTDSKLGQGRWYLPTLYEFQSLYGGYYEVGYGQCGSARSSSNLNSINKPFTALKNRGVAAEPIENSLYWAAAEKDNNYAWGINMSTGAGVFYKKNDSHYVRASLEIGCPSDAFTTLPAHSSGTKCITLDGKTKYTYFDCEDGFAESNGTCVATCAVGDVFYADGTCGKVDKYVQGSSKTPIGVVYYIADDYGTHGKVINLRDLGKSSSSSAFNPGDPYNTAAKLYWGYGTYDVPILTNYARASIVEKLKAHEPELYDGKGNTDKILNAARPQCVYKTNQAGYFEYCIPEAVQAAHAFYPRSDMQYHQLAGKGKWYLPALGELMELFGYDNEKIKGATDYSGSTAKNKQLVNATLTALKEKGVDAEALQTSYSYWSSTEETFTNAWVLSMSYGARSFGLKDSSNYSVRVSLQY